jgi:hypothetical protein
MLTEAIYAMIIAIGVLAGIEHKSLIIGIVPVTWLLCFLLLAR